MRHTYRLVAFRVAFGSKDTPVYDGSDIKRMRPTGGIGDRLTDNALEDIKELSRTRKGRRHLRAIARQRKEGTR